MTPREEDWAQAMRAERSGDSARYELFLSELALALRRLVNWRFRHLGLDPMEAEDVIQEILIAVHSKRRKWDATRPLLPWLNAIARYKAIDCIRRMRRENRLRVNLTDQEWLGISLSEDHSLLASDIERQLGNLTTQQRLVASAVGLNGLSHKQTARILGLSEGAVKVNFHRALKRLMVLAKGDLS